MVGSLITFTDHCFWCVLRWCCSL